MTDDLRGVAREFTLPASWPPLLGRLGLVGSGMFALHAASIESNLNLHDREHMVLLSLAWYVAAFVHFLLAATSRWPLRFLNSLTLVSVLFSVFLLGYTSIRATPLGIFTDRYINDVPAYSHEAGDLLLKGKNPYDVTGSEAVAEINRKYGLIFVEPTLLVDGSAIERLANYPAGHFLVFVPSLALGIDDVRWTLLAAVLVVMTLLWLGAPEWLRPFVALPLLANVGFSTTSLVLNSDYLWLAPMMAMIFFLRDRMGVAAILFGITIAIKQQPLLMAPFLLIWIWRTSERNGEDPRAGSLQFAGISLATFALFNHPFIFWSPGNWLGSVFYTATADVVPLGVGPTALDIEGILHIDREIFFVVTLLVAGLLLLLYWVRFDQLQHAVWIFPAILLWFGYRSLSHYFFFWPPLLLVGLIFAWKQGELTGERGPRVAGAFLRVSAALRRHSPSQSTKILHSLAASGDRRPCQ